MRITQDVREYAARTGVESEQALEQGLREKAQEFRRAGASVYVGEIGVKAQGE
jgi:phosphomethylpyrimidine synthase